MKLILSIDSIKYPLTGIGRYVNEVAARLLECKDEFSSLKLLGSRGFVQSLPSLTSTPGASHKLRGVLQKTPGAREAYRRINRAAKGILLSPYGDHIFHGPNFFLPRFSGIKIATFHDLSPFVWSSCFPSDRARYLQKELTFTVKNAQYLITDSEFIRDEVIDYFNLPSERVHTIPLACGPEFHPRAPMSLAPILEKYCLSAGAYALFVGTIEPRKNILGLLNAYRLLPTRLRQQFPLVLSGHEGWKSEDLHRHIKKGEREGWVRYLGYTDSGNLPLLYAGARAFIFPSFYEGFGLPVLEAMTSGVPVVCSDTGSLKEVIGDAGLVSPPDDIEMLSRHIEIALLDDKWRLEAIKKGIEKAAEYSWNRCAQMTLDVYRRSASQ